MFQPAKFIGDPSKGFIDIGIMLGIETLESAPMQTLWFEDALFPA